MKHGLVKNFMNELDDFILFINTIYVNVFVVLIYSKNFIVDHRFVNDFQHDDFMMRFVLDIIIYDVWNEKKDIL